MSKKGTGLRLDLGCGSNKKEGTIGIDIQSLPGVNYILDIQNERLPFDDASVEYVYSSHFFEHTSNPAHIFLEICRVCQDGARLELWTPYAWSNSAFLSDHKFFFAEDFYMHMGVWFLDFWTGILNARLNLHEFQYIVEPKTLWYLKKHRLSLDFGVRHLHNIVKEFCVHITVQHKGDLLASPSSIRRTFSLTRTTPRYEIKAEEYREPTSRELERLIRTFAKGKALPAWE